MQIISSNSGKMVLAHTGRDGMTTEINVSVDNDSRKWIKENIDNICYDATNDILKYKADGVNTTVARALVINLEADVPSSRNVQYNDGNKFNFKMKNLVVNG